MGQSSELYHGTKSLDVKILEATSEGRHSNVSGRKESSWPRWLARVVTTTAFAIFALALLSSMPLTDDHQPILLGAEAGAMNPGFSQYLERRDMLTIRGDSPTDVCTRWAHQSAIVNGTIYVYGGQASTQAGQTDNTWNNDFISIDVTKTWQVGSPSLKGLPQPSGPPAVALGTLWGSTTSLFLYGGEYSWKPVVSPSPYALWEYDIASSSWKEHNNPKTSSGDNSEDGGQAVQNAAEGAGLSIPELGRGFYFGGHLDGYTTNGWSQSVPRVYLKSLTEFTFPGYANNASKDLQNNQKAGSDGVWRNVTQGGLQDTNGFPERADGALVYVPGFGDLGIVIGLAGGTNTTFTELNVVDIYDIATSTWYKQSTSGSTPQIRVNPCAVAASAPDGSSTNIYMYGGQNLQPAGAQTQLDDLWILTVPSFTWIRANASSGNPPARAGHTCHLWDGQMIVVGGYVGTEISCDSPGIYVFNASSLEWKDQFTALSGSDNQNQQSAQKGSSKALSGSYGYQVPPAVYSVIGGNANGGATVTAPAAHASQGPLATGTPITYSVPGLQTSVFVTVSDGHTITGTATFAAATAGAGSSNTNSGASNDSSNGINNSARIGAIVAGVVAGVLLILIIYLLICLFIYRRQLALYKNHIAAAQRQTENNPGRAGAVNEKTAFLAATGAASSTRTGGPRGASSNRDGGSSFTDAQRAASSGKGSSKSGRASMEVWGPQHAQMPPLPPSRLDGGGVGAAGRGRSGSESSGSEDLLLGNEPTFVGVLLHPRRSLRVVNK